MPIEVKEIIVRTTVAENNKVGLDYFQLKKIKAEILNELKQEILKTEKRKSKR